MCAPLPYFLYAHTKQGPSAAGSGAAASASIRDLELLKEWDSSCLLHLLAAFPTVAVNKEDLPPLGNWLWFSVYQLFHSTQVIEYLCNCSVNMYPHRKRYLNSIFRSCLIFNNNVRRIFMLIFVNQLFYTLLLRQNYKCFISYRGSARQFSLLGLGASCSVGHLLSWKHKMLLISLP